MTYWQSLTYSGRQTLCGYGAGIHAVFHGVIYPLAADSLMMPGCTAGSFEEERRSGALR